MGGTCSTYESEKNAYKILVCKTLSIQMRNVGVVWRIISKQKYDVMLSA
jgi:hypothetical protein